MGFPGGASGKEAACQWGRSPGGGNGNPVLYSCLENSMDRGAWWAIVHGDAKSWTLLSARTRTHTHTQMHTHTHTHTHTHKESHVECKDLVVEY